MVQVVVVEGEEGVEVAEAEGAADRGVEVAVKEGGGQEAGEGEDAEVQMPNALQETTSRVPGWHTTSTTSSRTKDYRRTKECISEASGRRERLSETENISARLALANVGLSKLQVQIEHTKMHHILVCKCKMQFEIGDSRRLETVGDSWRQSEISAGLVLANVGLSKLQVQIEHTKSTPKIRKCSTASHFVSVEIQAA